MGKTNLILHFASNLLWGKTEISHKIVRAKEEMRVVTKKSDYIGGKFP